MYSAHLADELVKYYYDKLIHKPIDPLKEDSYLINVIKSTPVIGGTNNVMCFSMEGNEILSQRSIDLVARDYHLPMPSDVFK